MDNQLNSKIEGILHKIYIGGNLSSYTNTVELTFNLLEDKNSWINKFIEDIKYTNLVPVMGNVGAFPFFCFIFNLDEVKDELFSKSTQLIFYVSMQDDFYSYFFLDSWVFLKYKIYSAAEYTIAKPNIDLLFELKFRPPKTEIIYSERSLTEELDDNVVQLLSLFKDKFNNYLFIDHQYLFLKSYSTFFPFYVQREHNAGDSYSLFELLFDYSHRETNKIVWN